MFKPLDPPWPTRRRPASDWPLRLALALFYGVAGILHLVRPEPFIRIVPEMLPWPAAIVLVTGLVEIGGAALLLGRRTRRFAGAALALYALAVWPANFRHAFAGIDIAGVPTGWWYHAPRLALQPVLMLAALRAGGWFSATRP